MLGVLKTAALFVVDSRLLDWVFSEERVNVRLRRRAIRRMNRAIRRAHRRAKRG